MDGPLQSYCFSFASVATATQIILATLPLYSQNATWRSSTANTEHIFFFTDFAEAELKVVAEQFGESLKRANSSFSVDEALCELKLFKKNSV